MWFKKNETTNYSSSPSESDIYAIKSEEARKALAVIDYLTDGIVVIDAFRRISFINSEAEKMLEVKREQILSQHILKLGKYPWAVPLVTYLDSQTIDVSKKEMILKEDLILEVSIISMILSGESIDPLKKPDTLIMLRDITKEKKIYKMKNDFITVAAHQLRTPSSAVKWTIGMLLEGDSGPLSAAQQETMKKAYDANEKIIKLINELLDVSRIEEGGFLSHLVLVDISELINSLILTREPIVKNKNLNVIIEKPRVELPKVMLDLEKTKVALGILIDNAITYTFPQGTITIGVELKEEDLEIKVADTGIGIPEEQKKSVFNKFFRGSNAMKVHTDGTGLGLYIAKNIIEVQGGTIWFESREGKGTTFFLTVPIKEKYGEYLDKSFY